MLMSMRPKITRAGLRIEGQINQPAMTTLATLLSQKQHLLARLEEGPGPREHDGIEHALEKIDATLNSLDRPDRVA